MFAIRITLISLILISNLAFASLPTFSQALNPKPYYDIEDNYIYKDYAKVLNQVVTKKGLVNYKALIKDHSYLDRFILSLESISPEEYEFWTDEDTIAFWINLYNALSIKTIIDNYPLTNLEKKQYLWKKNNFIIMGKKISLEHIKHEILRKEFNDPRILMALCDGTRGSGIIRNRPYTGKNLSQQLSQQSELFINSINNFEIILNDSQIYISPIFKWYGKDFIKNYSTDKKYKGLKKTERATMNFIEHYLTPEKRNYLYSKIYFIDYSEYNWQLNDISNSRSAK